MELLVIFDSNIYNGNDLFIEMPIIPRIGETIYLQKPSCLSEDLIDFDCDENGYGEGLEFKVKDVSYFFNTDNKFEQIQLYLELRS